MKYFFIVFFGLFICLVDSYLLAECLTFKNSEGHRSQDNDCWSHSESSNIERIRHSTNCLKCQINNTNTQIQNDCGKSRQCISFIFYNNSFFEQFFRKFPILVNHLLKSGMHNNRTNKLIITLQNYNLTEISFKYLKSILNMDSPTYHVLHVIFIKPKYDRNLMEIVHDFSQTPFDVIYLSFSCNHLMEDTEWIEYKISLADTTPSKIKSCVSTRSKSSTTKSMSSFQTATSTRKSMNMTSSTFLQRRSNSLLFICFFICIIIGLFYIFFRYHRQNKLHGLTMRSSVTSSDTTGKSLDNADKPIVQSSKRVLYKIQDD